MWMLVFGTFMPDSKFAGRSLLISLTGLLTAGFEWTGRGSWYGSGQVAGQRENLKVASKSKTIKSSKSYQKRVSKSPSSSITSLLVCNVINPA